MINFVQDTLDWSFIINSKIRVGFLASSFANRSSSGTAKQFEAVAKLLCTKFHSKIETVLFCNNVDQYNYLKNDPAFLSARIIIFPNSSGKWLKSSRQYFKYAFSQNPFKVDILHFSVPRFYPFFGYSRQRNLFAHFMQEVTLQLLKIS